MFVYWEPVRVAPRSGGERAFLGWIASRPIGLNDVPAMGAYYFVVAASWCGYVSADRLRAVAMPQDASSRGCSGRGDVDP